MSFTIEPETVNFIDNEEKDRVSNTVSADAKPDKWGIPLGRISASTKTARKASRRISLSCDSQSNVIDTSERQSEEQDSPMTVAEAGR
jgi:hypothetical protein